jgi:hypothetical protein
MKPLMFVANVLSLRVAEYVTDHDLVVEKVRERLTVSKQTTHRFHMKRFNLKKLNKAESEEQYHVEFSNRIATLKTLDTEVDINIDWETIIENIKNSAKKSLGYYELKKHKQLFDETCSKLLGQRKQENCSDCSIQAKRMGII